MRFLCTQRAQNCNSFARAEVGLGIGLDATDLGGLRFETEVFPVAWSGYGPPDLAPGAYFRQV